MPENIVQLIINGTTYPEAIHNDYEAYEEDIGTDVEMISGRIVREVRGKVWIIKYRYEWLDGFAEGLTAAFLADMRSNAELPVAFLEPRSGVMQSGTFRVTKCTTPTYAYAPDGAPRWTGAECELREVRPHD